MLNKPLIFGGLLGAFAVPFALRGQEQPLDISTTVSTGYYSSATRGDVNQSLNFVPLGARFDMSGYYRSPDLINFSAEPELNLGPQASEAGFQGGNGIRIRTTLLRNGITPLTFRYSNLQVKDAYFGSLTQVSGYTVNNRNKDLGVTWELRPPGLPATTIDWGTGSVDSKSDIAEIPDYLSHGNHLNVDSRYTRWGWDFEGFAHRQRQESNLLAPLGGGMKTGSLLEKVEQYQVSVRRSFLGDWDLYANGGNQSTSSVLFALPIDLSTHYASANLRMFQKRRWKASLRANYSSNLASQLLAQAASTLNGPGSVAQQNILLPFSYGISNVNLNATTSVDLSHGWGAFGSVERNTVFSSRQENPLSANYVTTSAGLNYAGKFGWGNLSGEYSREFGIGSVTGQSGTIQGQHYVVSAQHGNSGGLQFDAAVHGSDQSVQNAQPFSNNSFSAEGNVADHLFGSVSGRLGGGWQWGSLVNGVNEFRTNGYTARAGIEHPLIQIGAALNDSVSDSLPFYSQVLNGLGIGSIVVAPLQIIPSDYRAMNFTLHANPLRKVEISAVWTRSRQHLQGILNNDFELLNVYATYSFRRIQLVAGYVRSNQTFAFYPQTMRKRFYVRMSRTARLL
jgi:hypothetical protein